MSHKFLFNATFHFLLKKMDEELAREVCQEGCFYCGSQLDPASYPRSPMGLPSQFRDQYDERLSFCCKRCRKRTTPPSVRFFGRRWFPAPIFILISVLALGINERRLSQVKHHFGMVVSESTWKRWRRWWRKSFGQTLFWQQAKGLIPTVQETHLSFPRALFRVFKGALAEKIPLLLRFLSPLTGGVLRAV